MHIGENSTKAKIDDLVVNRFQTDSGPESRQAFLEEYLGSASTVIEYDRDYDRGEGAPFKMVYPETFEAVYGRYLGFFNRIRANQKKRIAIMVSHGQSIPSFMELCEPDARKKDIIGVGYCCLSIAKVTKKEGLCE